MAKAKVVRLEQRRPQGKGAWDFCQQEADQPLLPARNVIRVSRDPRCLVDPMTHKITLPVAAPLTGWILKNDKRPHLAELAFLLIFLWSTGNWREFWFQHSLIDALAGVNGFKQKGQSLQHGGTVDRPRFNRRSPGLG